MLKFFGALLVILGCTGFGAACREEMKQVLFHTRCLLMILELLKSEIAYSKATLPEACRMIADRMEEPYRSSLFKIYEIMKTNRGLPFEKVWRQEMGKCLQTVLPGKKESELFLQFSHNTGFADNQMQIKALEQYCEMFAQSVRKQEESMENKARVVMSMGFISGIFLTIVLL